MTTALPNGIHTLSINTRSAAGGHGGLRIPSMLSLIWIWDILKPGGPLDIFGN